MWRCKRISLGHFRPVYISFCIIHSVNNFYILFGSVPSYQVDTYGLCVIVHMMLHNSYMEIDKKPSPDGGYVYLPKSSLKR